MRIRYIWSISSYNLRTEKKNTRKLVWRFNTPEKKKLKERTFLKGSNFLINIIKVLNPENSLIRMINIFFY